MIKVTNKKRSRKYFAPQNEGVKHKCEHPGCDKLGEFKAPKDKTLKEYYWFCLEHVQEYNSKWNYYTGEDDSPEQETFRRRTRFTGFSSKIKYKFGCDLEDDLDFLHGFTGYDKATDSVRYSKKDRDDMSCLELSSENLNKENLKDSLLTKQKNEQRVEVFLKDPTNIKFKGFWINGCKSSIIY